MCHLVVIRAAVQDVYGRDRHGELRNLAHEVVYLAVITGDCFGGSNYDEVANRSYDEEMAFTVIAIAKDLRGDAKLQAAMYPILEELKATLIDNNLELDI